MFTLKLKNTLNDAPEIEWQRLISEQLGADVHPGRAKGFCLARAALLEAMQECGVELEISDLELDQFDCLKGHGDFTLSLTHTNSWGAALLAPKKKYVSVGIDLEPKERIVKPFVLERISHPQDMVMEPIQRWVLKEAVFKTLMNTRRFDRNLEFSSIQLGYECWRHESGLEGGWSIHPHPELMIATAWLEA